MTLLKKTMMLGLLAGLTISPQVYAGSAFVQLSNVKTQVKVVDGLSYTSWEMQAKNQTSTEVVGMLCFRLKNDKGDELLTRSSGMKVFGPHAEENIHLATSMSEKTMKATKTVEIYLSAKGCLTEADQARSNVLQEKQ